MYKLISITALTSEHLFTTPTQSPVTSDHEGSPFMDMGALSSELDLLQETLNTSQYRSVSDLNLLYQSRKAPDSMVILSDGIFHDLLKAHEENVKALSGIMTPSAPRTSNILSAAITLVVGKHPYQKGNPKSKERQTLSFPYFITDGTKATEYRSVGYATEKRNGREKIYTEEQLQEDYNARLKKGCEILNLSKPKTLERPEHINHTEQEIYQSFIYNTHFYKDLIAFLDKHKVPRSAKIYAISIDMISDLKMCTHCQQTSIGGLDPTLKGNVMDHFVAIMSGKKSLPKSLAIQTPTYNFKPEKGPHSVVRMVWYWEKSGDRNKGLLPNPTTQAIPKNLRGYLSTQILGMHKQEIEIATPGQVAIVTSTHAKSLTGDTGEGTKRRESLSRTRSIDRNQSSTFPESPLKK